MNSRLSVIVIIYIISLNMIGRLIYSIPNRKYLSILNNEEFFAMSLILCLICFAVIFLLLKTSRLKKMYVLIAATIVIFIGLGTYYYSNLPQYTYEQAVSTVEEEVKKDGKSVEVHIPVHREDKLGKGERQFMKTTYGLYYIYLDVENESKVYRFNPLNGEYDPIDTDRKLEEYVIN